MAGPVRGCLASADGTAGHCPADRPAHLTETRAPSLARSSTQTTPSAVAWMATTDKATLPDTSMAGAVTEIATGSIDKALASEAWFGWACAGCKPPSMDKATAQASTKDVMSDRLFDWLNATLLSQRRVGRQQGATRGHLAASWPA